MENKIARIDGEVTSDGTYVVSREETSVGWEEKIKVGKLKIRGEREKRTISYQDYSKLNMFYASQERLIGDRKHISVHLSNGVIVNTADITSLELVDDTRIVKRELTIDDRALRELPTTWVNLTLDLRPIMRGEPKPEQWFMAKCHVRDGEPIIQKESIAELIKVHRGECEEPIVCRDEHFIYGLERRIESKD